MASVTVAPPEVIHEYQVTKQGHGKVKQRVLVVRSDALFFLTTTDRIIKRHVVIPLIHKCSLRNQRTKLWLSVRGEHDIVLWGEEATIGAVMNDIVYAAEKIGTPPVRVTDTNDLQRGEALLDKPLDYMSMTKRLQLRGLGGRLTSSAVKNITMETWDLVPAPLQAALTRFPAPLRPALDGSYMVMLGKVRIHTDSGAVEENRHLGFSNISLFLMDSMSGKVLISCPIVLIHSVYLNAPQKELELRLNPLPRASDGHRIRFSFPPKVEDGKFVTSDLDVVVNVLVGLVAREGCSLRIVKPSVKHAPPPKPNNDPTAEAPKPKSKVDAIPDYKRPLGDLKAKFHSSRTLLARHVFRLSSKDKWLKRVVILLDNQHLVLCTDAGDTRRDVPFSAITSFALRKDAKVGDQLIIFIRDEHDMILRMSGFVPQASIVDIATVIHTFDAKIPLRGASDSDFTGARLLPPDDFVPIAKKVEGKHRSNTLDTSDTPSRSEPGSPKGSPPRSHSAGPGQMGSPATPTGSFKGKQQLKAAAILGPSLESPEAAQQRIQKALEEKNAPAAPAAAADKSAQPAVAAVQPAKSAESATPASAPAVVAATEEEQPPPPLQRQKSIRAPSPRDRAGTILRAERFFQSGEKQQKSGPQYVEPEAIYPLFASYPVEGSPFPELPEGWTCWPSRPVGRYCFSNADCPGITAGGPDEVMTHSHPITNRVYYVTPQEFLVDSEVSVEEFAQLIPTYSTKAATNLTQKDVAMWAIDQRVRQPLLDSIAVTHFRIKYRAEEKPPQTGPYESTPPKTVPNGDGESGNEPPTNPRAMDASRTPPVEPIVVASREAVSEAEPAPSSNELRESPVVMGSDPSTFNLGTAATPQDARGTVVEETPVFASAPPPSAPPANAFGQEPVQPSQPAPYSGPSKAAIIAVFAEMKALEEMTNAAGTWNPAATAYEHVVVALREFQGEIRSGADAEGLPNVTPSSVAKITEFIDTGKVDALEKLREKAEQQARPVAEPEPQPQTPPASATPPAAVSESPPPPAGPFNEALVGMFAELRELEVEQGNTWAVEHCATAMAALQGLGREVSTAAEVGGVAGIDAASAAKIDEFLRTGRLEEMDKLREAAAARRQRAAPQQPPQTVVASVAPTKPAEEEAPPMATCQLLDGEPTSTAAAAAPARVSPQPVVDTRTSPEPQREQEAVSSPGLPPPAPVPTVAAPLISAAAHPLYPATSGRRTPTRDRNTTPERGAVASAAPVSGRAMDRQRSGTPTRSATPTRELRNHSFTSFEPQSPTSGTVNKLRLKHGPNVMTFVANTALADLVVEVKRTRRSASGGMSPRGQRGIWIIDGVPEPIGLPDDELHMILDRAMVNSWVVSDHIDVRAQNFAWVPVSFCELCTRWANGETPVAIANEKQLSPTASTLS